ncbi:PQQ-dependent sugar dehydrogenase [Nocardia sp. alder85J]|uniref:PQQ-dependent sugar dehydrogenase n=1 Tax=Nocardia sp. alder85J TaxID=2862949 RepID=UPI001CD5450D|nr:PQQ-dependent sugar dehydrogenase [Nocardia sp. alder85J]MCX4093945.1 PQQ-dependent sugar dehydrogenase [Nocardia sp. alder85J]
MSLVVAGRIVAILAVTAGLVSGCARFDESASKPFTPAPTIEPEGMGPTSPQAPTTTKRPPGPCEDPDPAVIASCVNDPTGLIPLPDGLSGLVAERSTGKVFLIDTQDPGPWPEYLKQVAQVDVDASGDGGLNDIALSPSYNEDHLLYAYITTPSDNRVVRIGSDGTAKPILTGIPKGASGNHGSLLFTDPDKLVVLTGDAGNPGAANDPGSLAGKLLQVDSPRSGSSAAPQVLVSGIGTAGGLCQGDQGNLWFTDRTAVEDRLQRLASTGTVSTAWTWPDHPGVAGCAAGVDFVAVAMTTARGMAFAKTEKDTYAITAAPGLLYQDKWGRLNAAAPGPNGTIWVDTVNKVGGQPTPTDDRVVVIAPSGGGGGRE